MKLVPALLAAALLALAGCGDDEEAPASAAAPKPAPTATPEPAATAEKGTKVVLGESDFGDMLFDARKQAIYIFEKDPKGESSCYDDCAEAWPPVFSDGDPVAGKGVDAKLLGTTERRDGRLQVTYAGQPLYFYAHEGPGQVLCHNVNLNGGLWWVVGPDGKRRP